MIRLILFFPHLSFVLVKMMMSMKMIFVLVDLVDVLVQLHVLVRVPSVFRHRISHLIFFEKLYHYVLEIDLMMNLLMANELSVLH